jgi:histidine kinase
MGGRTGVIAAIQRFARWLPLRWHLIGAQMAVVLVGVVTLTLALEWVLRNLDPAALQGAISALPGVTGATINPESMNALLDLVRRTSFQALFVAAMAATLTGLATSLLLTREILRSLNALARGSRRIARGHYGERVAVPPSNELAAVAINFNQMAEALEQVEQQRVLLIGNVMHELRTPLSALSALRQSRRPLIRWITRYAACTVWYRTCRSCPLSRPGSSRSNSASSI